MSALGELLAKLEKMSPMTKELHLPAGVAEEIGEKAGNRLSVDELKQLHDQTNVLKQEKLDNIRKQIGTAIDKTPPIDLNPGTVINKAPQPLSQQSQVDKLVEQMKQQKEPNIIDVEKARQTNVISDNTPEWMKKLRGVGVMGGAGSQVDINPMNLLSQGYNKYADVRDKAHEALAGQLDLSGQDKSNIQQVLGIAADPLNVVEGPVGVGLNGMQAVMEHLRNNQKSEDEFKKTKGVFANGKTSLP